MIHEVASYDLIKTLKIIQELQHIPKLSFWKKCKRFFGGE